MAIQNSAVTELGNNIFVCPGTLGTDIQEHAATCMIFCNVSAFSVSVNVWVIPEGNPRSSDFAGDAPPNQIIKSLEIPAGETVTFDTEKLVLTTGDSIHALVEPGQANRLIATVSSMRVS